MFLPVYVNRNYYKDQLDILLYESHYFLVTKVHNRCWNNNKSIYIFVEDVQIHMIANKT